VSPRRADRRLRDVLAAAEAIRGHLTRGSLDDVVTGCRACPRPVAGQRFGTRRTGGRPVSGFGPGDAALALVGLANQPTATHRAGYGSVEA